MSSARVVSKTQRIIVNPAQNSISIINAGPVGPGGPVGIDGGMPGEVRMWAGSVIPATWEDCDGGAISRLGNPLCFAAIGTTWGAGDGVNTFNKPDMRGRAPIGVGTGAGLTNRALASTVGTETHILTPGETAVKGHGHTFTGSSVTSGDASVDHTHGMQSHTHALGTHTHGMQSHTHTLGTHTHGMQSHTHALGSHTHNFSTNADDTDHAHYTSGNTGNMSENHVHGGWNDNYIVGYNGTVSANITQGGGAFAAGPTTDWADQNHYHGWGAWSGGRSAYHYHHGDTRGPSTGSDGPSNNTTTSPTGGSDGPSNNTTTAPTGGSDGPSNNTTTGHSVTHTHSVTAAGTVSTLADGANGTAHNNMQPSIALKFIIKVG